MSDQRATIGFAGLGLMGRGMARNILAKGWPLVVLAHRRREAVEQLTAQGAREAGTARELAQACDIVHLCVTGSPQVESLVRGPDGLLAGARPGLVIVDCSSSNPVSTLALADEAAARGVHFVDAPLSRTPKEAEAGTLDTMVGAAPEVFARIEPVLRCWAGHIVHLGPVGLGHKMKLINNFVAMGYAALFAEALAIARKAGLSIAQFHAVIGSGRMRSPFYDTFMQWSLAGDENAHRFTISNAHKDMRYLAAMANELGVVNTLQAQVKNSFAAMEAAGQGERFVPMLADFVAALNALPPAAQESRSSA
ncbi:MAG: NAD(P)-dependent oxidoreductase [Piscinibacter sp.]|uniref:NAD(P)-dependent oxidoreductase n=1 Tax=Piscinibacter TaxID=1114981 RepID=UPI000FDE89EA|nr:MULTISPECIES: NAD(P)-dependent oxidoreductase [Piscinibacter]MCW5667609.1 NAD(P)-dependent oxidoreductase [Piscinibacter sp.]